MNRNVLFIKKKFVVQNSLIKNHIIKIKKLKRSPYLSYKQEQKNY